ncbi:hypothetical protein BDW02DRAFT_432661 [Decorospora gaudefroyi]|uniref:Uncharacterized protein n=1 Tax=Decorospora gaudefroyi TaxID=184978 RepID=A0A6A5K642_9PLEO|nr:hypothetical protein BDW02DRAFT_432661 [Decorospora gaudefroyi]
MPMPGILGFPGQCNRPYDDPYSSSSESYGRNGRDQRRLFAEFQRQRQAYLHACNRQQSPLGDMGGLQSPFANQRGRSPMMGGYPQFGSPSPLGMGMGVGLGMEMGMGPGMTMGPGMCMDPRMAMGIGPAPGMGMGMGRGMGYSGRPSFMTGSPINYRQVSPFGLSNSRRPHFLFPNRHRHRSSQQSWPQARRSPFSSPSFLDDDDDESDYDVSPMSRYPGRSRESMRQLGRSPYRSHGRQQNWIYGPSDGYNEYDDDDDDDDDDESDYEDFFPSMRRRQQRY